MIDPLQNGTPPIKQPWGLLIQGKHYMIHHCPQKVGWRTFLNKALRGQRISQISRDLDYVQFLLTKLFLGWICWGNPNISPGKNQPKSPRIPTQMKGFHKHQVLVGNFLDWMANITVKTAKSRPWFGDSLRFHVTFFFWGGGMVSAKCDPKSKVGIVTNPTIIARSVLALG